VSLQKISANTSRCIVLAFGHKRYCRSTLATTGLLARISSDGTPICGAAPDGDTTVQPAGSSEDKLITTSASRACRSHDGVDVERQTTETLVGHRVTDEHNAPICTYPNLRHIRTTTQFICREKCSLLRQRQLNIRRENKVDSKSFDFGKRSSPLYCRHSTNY